MEVNYFGALAMTREFSPLLGASGGGAVVNMLSVLAFASLPRAATYSASKAACLSLTRNIRAEARRAAHPGYRGNRGTSQYPDGDKMPEPRMKPVEIVSDALDEVQAGANEEVVAGAQSRNIYQQFLADPKGVQAMMLMRLPQRARSNPQRLLHVDSGLSEPSRPRRYRPLGEIQTETATPDQSALT